MRSTEGARDNGQAPIPSDRPPQRNQERTTATRPGPMSALGVAGPGADDAILAAEVVALLQRGILRLAQPVLDGIAMWTANILAVDGDCPAGTQDRDDLAAAYAFAERCPARGRLFRIIVGKAVGAARPDGERAGRL